MKLTKIREIGHPAPLTYTLAPIAIPASIMWPIVRVIKYGGWRRLWI